ncbi:ribonuclease H-like domain-containing protein [Tanacetum coccineum]
MDLFRPVTPRSIKHEKYTLVIVDEYSRYTWVYFLKKKSQAPETIMSFIKRVENKNNIKVKQLRTDNGIVFMNSIIVNFCDEKGISQNFSSPYTPEQNGVAERKNSTLIEIIPNINFLHVFGCPVYIHNHKDYLGKFDEKANDGYLLRYSLVSKAFRVFNTRRQQTKETYHITFDESPDAIKFSKPLVDNINIAENERYPPDEYLHPYEPSQRYQTNSNDVSFIEPYECPEPVVLETEVSSDQNGQTDQNDQSVQNDEILNDDHSEHSNHTNDEQIIDNLPNTKDIQISEHSSSPRVEDTLVQNTIPILNPPLPIPSIVTDCPVTTEKKVQKKNDVKVRSMLLMALPNEHLMTFNQYKDAKTLFAAIQTRFSGNEATKKTQKTLLKQMYENFSAPSTESLDSIFNRLQKIVSQLAILGENISQEDLNLKFLRSLPSEWNTHVVVWRNKPDLDTMSFDDLYNNFKIVEQEVKGTASSSSSSSSQNMAFVSSPSSTNEVNTAYGVSTANTQVSPASTQVSTASTQVSTANLSDDTVYAFLASQPNGSQLVYEDLEQIHEDDIEEMDLKWQLALLSMRTRRFFQKTGRKITINRSDTTRYDKSKVECFNCHKLGHFSFLLAIDGAGFDWSFMADEEVPSDMDLMAFLDSEEFQQPEFEGYGHKSSKSVSEDISNEVMKSLDASLVEELGHPQIEDQAYVDSGCSRHTTGNMSYLSDFKEFDGGYVTFGGGAKGGRNTGKGTLKTGKLDFEDVYFVKELQFNLFSVSQMCDKKNNVLFTDTGCFVLSPDFKLADESQVLLKVPRKNNMYSVDMKNIVPKESLTCLVAKATLDESMLWHRRLATKDETSGILKSFITEIKNLVDKKVKVIRCDNGTEFKNRSYTRNRTLIEAAGTMLADSKLPTTFWAEAVNTTCYVQNRVLVIKPHNKTPYELVRGRTPALSFMRPFGCHVTILNTLNHLGKFNGKSDDGFFIGYSLNSKALGIQTSRTGKVEESLHIKFLEDKPIIVGDGPKWLFDIDVLTQSMNYVLVVAGTNSNDFAGTKESFGAGHSNKETRSRQDYIVMPLWKNDSLFDSSSKNASDAKPQPSSDIEKKDDEGVSKDSGFDYQERTANNTQDDNDARPSINTASTNVNTGSSNINIVNLKVTTALIEATYDDLSGYETEADMSNITTTYLVSSTPNTRIHKDHSLAQMIGVIQSGVLTRGMIKTTNDQGFISVVYEGKTHEDLHTCLFAYFLSQEEPKRIPKALNVRIASTPMDTEKPLLKDSDGDDVDAHLHNFKSHKVSHHMLFGKKGFLGLDKKSQEELSFLGCRLYHDRVKPKLVVATLY